MSVQIASIPSTVTYTVGAVPQGTFSVPFPYDDTGDIQVIVNGVPAPFSLTVGSVDSGIVTAANVTLAGPVTYSTVILTRATMLEQQALFATSGSFRVETLNREIARLWMAGQDLAADIGDAISLPLADRGAPPQVLPLAAQRANRLLGFDSAGRATTYALPSSGQSFGGDASSATVAARSGATARSLAERALDLPNIRDFGAVADGVTDARAAIQSVLDYLNLAGGGTVFIPAGRYKLTAALVLPNNVQIMGVGAGSVFVLATAGMTGIQQLNNAQTNSFIGVASVCFEQAAANCTAISFRLARFTALEDITFLGVTTCFYIDRGMVHRMEKLRSVGTSNYPAGGATLTSLSDTDHCHHVVLNEFSIFDQGTGSPAIGLMIRRGVNVAVNDMQTYGTTATIAIVVENGCECAKITRLLTAGCAAGVLIQQGPGVAKTPIYTTIKDSNIDQPSAYGVKIDGGIYTVLHGVGITAVPATINVPAIMVQGAIDTSILDCHAADLTGPNGAFIVFYGTASDAALIEGNTVRNCKAGINLAVACTGIVAQGNRFDVVTSPIVGTIAGVGNAFRDNPGGNPLTIVAPAMPASTSTILNNYGADLRVYVNGGSNVSVRVNGLLLTTGLASSSYVLKVGETIRIDYSTAPTWAWCAL